MISGAPAKGNADFPPEAVQHFHEKPTPTHDARPAHCSRPIIIQQPRKWAISRQRIELVDYGPQSHFVEFIKKKIIIIYKYKYIYT